MIALNEKIVVAAERVAAKDWTAATPLLVEAIGSPAFGYLPAERRHALLMSAVGVALAQEDFNVCNGISREAPACRARRLSVGSCGSVPPML